MRCGCVCAQMESRRRKAQCPSVVLALTVLPSPLTDLLLLAAELIYMHKYIFFPYAIFDFVGVVHFICT